MSGKFAKTGIPASIVTRFLAEHGVIVEKTGLYSFFIMFTIGITKGRWNTLVTALQQFKDDYDKNQPLWRILPEFVAKQPQYERVGLRDLCQQIHDMYKTNDVARVTTEMYLSDMQPAMKPSDAFACMAHREIDRVEIDDLEGRVTSVLLTPYPPGIPLLIPGERFNRTIVEYLKFARTFNAQFPGFDTDIHGLVEEAGRHGQDPLLHGLRAASADADCADRELARRQPVGAQSARTGRERNRRLSWLLFAGAAVIFVAVIALAVFRDGRSPPTACLDGAHRVHRGGRHPVSARRAVPRCCFARSCRLRTPTRPPDPRCCASKSSASSGGGVSTI